MFLFFNNIYAFAPPARPILWLDGANPAYITRSYADIVPTGSGTSGTTTITASASVSAVIPVGAKLRIGATDIYTVSAVSTTTITTVETLTATYTAGSALAVQAVSKWKDKSGNINSVIQNTDSLKPVYAPNIRNGNSCIWFGADGLAIPSGVFPVPNGANTIFIVAQSTLVDANDRAMLTLSEGGNGRYVLRHSAVSGEINFVNNTSNTNPVTATNIVKANWNVYTGSFNGTSGLTLAVNAGSNFTASTGAAENGCDAGSVGANGPINTAFFRGYIGEVIVYDKLLNSAEIAQVKAYLANKWSVTSPLLYNPLLWLDGSDPAGTGVAPADNTAISSFKDKSGFTFNFAQATGAKQPIFKTNIQNGKGALQFTTLSEIINSGTLAAKFTTTMTAFFVMKTTLNSDFFPMTATPDDLSNRLMFIVPLSATSSVYFDFGNVFGNGRVVGGDSTPYDVTYIHAFEVDPSASDKMVEYRNGDVTGVSPNSDTFNATGKSLNIGFLGSTGYLMEALLFNYAFSDTQRAAITSYLNAKWGVY